MRKVRLVIADLSAHPAMRHVACRLHAATAPASVPWDKLLSALRHARYSEVTPTGREALVYERAYEQIDEALDGITGIIENVS